jgi:hypothetical protein
MLRKIANISSVVQTHWRPILLENPGALISAFFAIPLAFAADYLASNTDVISLLIGGDVFEGVSYLIAIVIILIIYLIGVLCETRKFIFYNRTCIHLPVIINIANSTDSQDALKIFVQSLAERPHSKITKINNDYLYSLERYLTISSEDLVFQYNVDLNKQNELYDIFAIIRHDLTRLQKQTPKHHILEIAYIGPVAIALWLGAITNTESLALWPYNSGAEHSVY